MSWDEDDAAREEYESDIAGRALAEEGLQYALENHAEAIREEVEQWQADEWLERSRPWLQLLNIISQYDREQFKRAFRNSGTPKGGAERWESATDSQLFELGSAISQFLESIADHRFKPKEGKTYVSGPYGFCPGPPVQPLALYSWHCDICVDLSWVADLLKVTRAFREILFVLGDSRKRLLELEVAEKIRVLDAALREGTTLRLVYRGLEGKVPRFDRAPDPMQRSLSSLLAEWMCEYLVDYLDRIDLGACVECGKIFPRQRRDNSYCSKTCQNRIAYKRKKIFDGGLLQKVELKRPINAENLQFGLWAYHARLGLGLVQATDERYGSFTSITVRFPQAVRTFRVSGVPQADDDAPKVEFYRATDPAALAEFL